LNANADVRAMTLSPGICASALMISSESPSLNHSWSFPALMSAKGRTAMEGGASTPAGLARSCSSEAFTSAIV
jgi:hypothetical protein